MMSELTESELDGFTPERYSSEKVSVSGQPRLGNVVEIEYSSRAGGAYGTTSLTEVRGELLYATPAFGDEDRPEFVVRDSERGRAVSVRLKEDPISGTEVRSLAARKSKRGQRLGELRSVTFTEDSVNTLAPATNALRRARSGDTIHVDGTEYGVVSTTSYGPSDRPDRFSGVLTTRDGDEFVLKTWVQSGEVKFSVRFSDHGEELELDPSSVQSGRFRERYFDHENEGLTTEDTTDAFPAPHGAREGERLTFTLTDEDGEPAEQVSGEVTDVRYYEQRVYRAFGDPEERPPETTVELDDGREVRLKNTGRRSRRWVTRSRREKMGDTGKVNAWVITHHEDADNEHARVEAVDIQREGGDVETDGGERLMADGGDVSPEDAGEGDIIHVVYESPRSDEDLTREGKILEIERWDTDSADTEVDTIRFLTPSRECRVRMSPCGRHILEQKSTGWTKLGRTKSLTITGEDPEPVTDGGEDIPEVVIPGEDSGADHFHAVLSPCSFHLSDSERVPVNNAQARGFSACSSCDPPTYSPGDGKVLRADGGDTPESLASAVSDALASSDIPLNRVSVSVDEVNADVTVQGNGAVSREDWNELRDAITDALDDAGFTYRAESQWAFVEVTGREVMTDGGVAVATDGGGGPSPDEPGGSGEDPHREVKVKVARTEPVLMASTVGEDGQYLAIWRDADADDAELEKYHLVMELAEYVDVDPFSTLDEDPGGVGGEGVALDLWKPKQAMTDGGCVSADAPSELETEVGRALSAAGVGHAVELKPRGGGVTVTYTGPSRERITDALDAAGLTCGGGIESVTGPDAGDISGRLHVSGFQDGGEPDV